MTALPARSTPGADTFDPSLVDFEVFAMFLEARRIHRGKTPLRVAREAEITLEAVFRASRGRNPGGFEFFALCEWIGEEPRLFLKKELRHG
ncbi:hypothetical protein FJ872_19530 [Mesorhizobium sp. B2-5-9]|uniref:hypothetical protein n=1 Tax=Mesorhizobium sp. B2-5-9 TaxID=2589921 RepID=UPI001126D8F0|nr:hypothetical protein [Mesorhizobium sp. B2-5-9]TPK15189.1 hypothetical protein FJ872_19530 [Mesorhizobium sp. B2-5-9]